MQVDFQTGTFYLGDCFDVMATLSPGSVDMVLNDPPYGTTQNKWDAVIQSGRRWICIERDPEYFAKAVARVYDAEAAL